MQPTGVPSQFGQQYQVLQELGRGGSATVYLARDEVSGETVAVKVLRPELAYALGAERFANEVALMTRLRHPGIVPVLDSGRWQDQLYLVMPYVSGTTLRQRLDREPQLPVAEVVRLGCEVAEALAHAHECGLVHRDVKPENVLLRADGSPVLTDFGLAHVVDLPAAQRLTSSGVIVGTPAYMSPEQAAGDRVIDARSDQYSLACVLYEALAGVPPYVGPTARSVMTQRVLHPPHPLSAMRGNVPAAVEGAVMRALSPVPADRFSDMSSFASALRRGDDASPPRTRRTALLGRRTAARRALLACVTAGLLVIVSRGVLARSRGETAAASRTAQARIAVMYFDDHTPGRALQPLADALTEEVIAELSGVNAFAVVPRNGVKYLRDRSLPLDSAFSRLGVHALVSGSTQRDGDSIRIRVQLIDSSSQSQVATASLVRPLRSAAALDQEVAQVVAASLRRWLGHDVRLRPARRATSDPRVLDLVQRARRVRDDALFLSAGPARPDASRAARLLDSSDAMLVAAARMDARWGELWTERAWTWHAIAALRSGDARAASIDSGLALAERAVALDARPEAFEARGVLRFERGRFHGGDSDAAGALDGAERDLRAALQGDSTLARSWATLSFVQWMQGRFREASLSGRRALEEDAFLDNASEVLSQLFYVALMLGEHAAADAWCARGFRAAPDDWRFTECRLTALLYGTRGPQRVAHAWALVDTLADMDPPDHAAATGHPYSPMFRLLAAAAVSARAGHPARARKVLRLTEEMAASDSALRVNRLPDAAYVAWCLGDSAEARRMLAAHVAARPVAAGLLARDPLLRPILAPATTRLTR